MESTGAFKQKGSWQLLLAVYQAAELIDRKRADVLIATGRRLASINAALFENQKLSGPALGDAIRAKRLDIIRNIGLHGG